MDFSLHQFCEFGEKEMSCPPSVFSPEAHPPSAVPGDLKLECSWFIFPRKPQSSLSGREDGHFPQAARSKGGAQGSRPSACPLSSLLTFQPLAPPTLLGI